MAERRELPVNLWRGDSFLLPIYVTLADEPLPLEGYTVTFSLKLDPTASDATAKVLYEAVVPQGDAEGLVGRHDINVSSATTQELLYGAVYTYQVMLTSPEGHRTTCVWGKVRVGDS